MTNLMTTYDDPNDLPLVVYGQPVDPDAWYNSVRAILIALRPYELSLDGPVADVTGIGTTEQTVWTESWTPSKTGTFEIRAAAGHDGTAGEQAKFRLKIDGVEQRYRLVEQRAGSFVDYAEIIKRVEVTSTATRTVTMTAQRTSGTNTFNSRIANRVLEIDYVGPTGLIQA